MIFLRMWLEIFNSIFRKSKKGLAYFSGYKKIMVRIKQSPIHYINRYSSFSSKSTQNKCTTGLFRHCWWEQKVHSHLRQLIYVCLLKNTVTKINYGIMLVQFSPNQNTGFSYAFWKLGVICNCHFMDRLHNAFMTTKKKIHIPSKKRKVSSYDHIILVINIKEVANVKNSYI